LCVGALFPGGSPRERLDKLIHPQLLRTLSFLAHNIALVLARHFEPFLVRTDQVDKFGQVAGCAAEKFEGEGKLVTTAIYNQLNITFRVLVQK